MRRNSSDRRLGQRADQQRLRQPRHAHQQAMPAGKHRHQQLLDHLPLADDHLAQPLGNQPVGLAQFLNGLRSSRSGMNHLACSGVAELFSSPGVTPGTEIPNKSGLRQSSSIDILAVSVATISSAFAGSFTTKRIGNRRHGCGLTSAAKLLAPVSPRIRLQSRSRFETV